VVSKTGDTPAMTVCATGANLDTERMRMNAWRIRMNPRAVNGVLAVKISGGDGAPLASRCRLRGRR
jgi:hypothetical protein